MAWIFSNLLRGDARESHACMHACMHCIGSQAGMCAAAEGKLKGGQLCLNDVITRAGAAARTHVRIALLLHHTHHHAGAAGPSGSVVRRYLLSSIRSDHFASASSFFTVDNPPRASTFY
jgi:hypothetical protein